MAFPIIGATREQQGVYHFTLIVNKTSAKEVSWRSAGSSVELWVNNKGNREVEISFDGGNAWWPLPAGGIDIYRQKLVGFIYRRVGASGSTTLRCMLLTANPNPKPTLAVGQKDDGKVR